jgi:hypothetical protein
MAKVAERLSVIKMSSEERNEYIYYQKQSVHSQDILNAARAEGEAKGIEKRNIEVAVNMIKQELNDKLISSVTGLSLGIMTSRGQIRH